MRIPTSINTNCLIAYKPKNTNERNNILNWDKKIPKTLQELCIESISRNWKVSPHLNEIILPENRRFLLEILSENLPLSLTIPKINYDIYWEKCYKKRWSKQLPVIINNGINETYKINYFSRKILSNNYRKISIKINSTIKAGNHHKSWKQYYCEMHLQNYLENLEPEKYNAEFIKELCDLLGEYIEILKIHKMISSKNSSNKIPLGTIITGLPNLKRISLCFNQISAKGDFSWNILKTSLRDIQNFAIALEKIINLQELKIINSDINYDKCFIISNSLLQHNNLTILDFRSCKISNKGVAAIADLLMEINLKELYLANNLINEKGVKSLAKSLLFDQCKLEILDLHLNNLKCDGVNVLFAALTKNNSLQKLFLSGCGLNDQVYVAEFISGNFHLQCLDISNNILEKSTGVELLNALNFNTHLKILDIRMCKIPPNIEIAIHKGIDTSRKGFKESKLKIVDNRIWGKLLEEIL